MQTGADQFEAVVSPIAGANNPVAMWSAYWTITENGHVTKVKAGKTVVKR